MVTVIDVSDLLPQIYWDQVACGAFYFVHCKATKGTGWTGATFAQHTIEGRSSDCRSVIGHKQPYITLIAEGKCFAV